MTAVAAPVRVVLNTGSHLADDGDGLGDAGELQRELEVLGDAEAQRDVVRTSGREAAERRGHLVGTADAHAGHDEASVRLRDRFVRRARRLVDGQDGRAGDDRALGVADDAGNRCRWSRPGHTPQVSWWQGQRPGRPIAHDDRATALRRFIARLLKESDVHSRSRWQFYRGVCNADEKRAVGQFVRRPQSKRP